VHRLLRRWRLWTLITLMLAAASIAFFLVLSEPSYRIDLPTHSKIKDRMTLEQVERLIGSPPGCYTNARNVPYLLARVCPPIMGQNVFTKDGFRIVFDEPVVPNVLILRAWLNDEAAIQVYFTEDGKELSKSFYSFPREGYKAKLLRKIRELLP
jgi:hypothetical protein